MQVQYEIIKIDREKLKQLNTSEFTIEDIEISNDNEYKNLCELLKKVKGKEKEIKEFFKEPKAQAYKNHKEITTLEKEMLDKLSRFETLAKKRIGEYQLKLEETNTVDNPLTIPEVKGISSQDVYKWKVVDMEVLKLQWQIGDSPLFVVNEELINQLVKATNGTINIPGIEIYKEKSVRVKGE